LQYISPPDIKKFGLIPEIVGRMPVVTFLHPLKPDALRRILIEPKNALIKQYVKLLEMDGVQLRFEDEVLDFVVEKAVTFKLGARGLRSIVEGILTDAMFELPSKKSAKELVVTLQYAEEKFRKTSIAKLRVA
jgi:ATP-dependent Clp protease ATP-binding subunit ClpX